MVWPVILFFLDSISDQAGVEVLQVLRFLKLCPILRDCYEMEIRCYF